MKIAVPFLLLWVPNFALAQTLHIVSAGVDIYHKGEKPDPWGKDARRVAKMLSDHSELNVTKHVLAGEKATKERLLNILQKVKADSYDQVFVYIGMHGGVNRKRGFMICTHGSKDDVKECLTGAELAEAVNKLPCRVILAIDTCHAGAMLDTPTPRAIVLCACQKDETAYGNTMISAMRKGIEGAADKDKNRRITFAELIAFIPNRCAQTSNGKQNPVTKK